MSGQGYHLALDAEQAARLLACRSEIEVVDCVYDLREGFWASGSVDRVGGGDKEWNALLLCLTRGSYDPEGGEPPLNRCFFGGRHRFFERSESWALDEEYGYSLFRDLRKLARFYRKAAEDGRAGAFYTDDYLKMFHDPPPDE